MSLVCVAMDSSAALVISHAFQLTRTIDRSGTSVVVTPASAIPPWYRLCWDVPPVGGSMANDRKNQDQEQLTDDSVMGKATGENEEFDDDVDEFDDEDSDQDEADVNEE